ncbi:MFS transporter [Cellulomonas sp. RIT-PI-Y]|uniref:MFS transporter n=1 Tax=Cellulomonas sp. RIT-PI-Y TaxID=3035297 RepID=UPI0021DAF71E|nr:MFS transporter [Cellulomonas sp. RIT-PI-Y]
MTSRTPPIRILIASAYAPAALFETGLGAITPVVPLLAVRLGGGLGEGALIVALLGVGLILGDVPAGALASRIGDRRAMLLAALVAAVALAGCALAPSLPLLALGVLVVGAVSAVFHLARQSFLTDVIPVAQRARALSTLGGVGRIGAFLGPFLGAGLLHLAPLRSVFWLAAAVSLLAGAVVALAPDVDRSGAVPRTAPGTGPGAWTLLRRHGRMFATLGLAVVLVGAVRATRQVVLPLWSEHLGLAPATTSLIFGLSGAVDVLLFYPGGRLMDRRGRLWVAVPSMLVLGGAIALLPLTGSVGTLAIAAMVMGFGNGISSGVLMTLGADVAPPEARATFLGVWRVFQDTGSAAGPLVVSAVGALAGLAAGIVTMGVAGLVGAAALARWVPRWSEHANARTRAEAARRRLAG